MGKKFNQYSVPGDGFIGKGAFGQVLKVFDSSLGTQESENLKAMKAMELNEIADNELAVLIRLDHENIVKYYDHFEVNVRDSNQQHLNLCVITEFCAVLKFLFF